MTQKSREKFVELAEKRVNRAVKDLRLIGNLSNRSNYSYGNDDVRSIFAALQKELERAHERFQKHSDGTDGGPFQLKI
jgi:hypothetical protein